MITEKMRVKARLFGICIEDIYKWHGGRLSDSEFLSGEEVTPALYFAPSTDESGMLDTSYPELLYWVSHDPKVIYLHVEAWMQNKYDYVTYFPDLVIWLCSID